MPIIYTFTTLKRPTEKTGYSNTPTK